MIWIWIGPIDPIGRKFIFIVWCSNLYTYVMSCYAMRHTTVYKQLHQPPRLEKHNIRAFKFQIKVYCWKYCLESVCQVERKIKVNLFNFKGKYQETKIWIAGQSTYSTAHKTRLREYLFFHYFQFKVHLHTF